MNKLSLLIQRPFLVAAILTPLLALVLACGPGEQPTPAPTATAVAIPTTTGPVATPTSTSTPAPTATPTPGKPSGSLVVVSDQLAGEAVDPFLALINTRVYMRLLYDYLVDVDRDGVLDPKRSLAERWTASPDNKSYDFSIRPGVKFHNGEELDAEDVKFGIDRMLRPGTQSASINNLQKSLDRVEVVDRYTVRIYTKNQTPFMLHYLSPLIGTDGMAVPKDYITSAGDDTFRKAPVGSGPYAFAEQRVGDFLKFRAVDAKHWRAGVPRYEEILYRVIPEQQTKIALLKTSAVDVIGASPRNARELEKEGYKVFIKPDTYNVALILPEWTTAPGPISDVKVREAMRVSIDLKAINKSLFEDFATITSNSISSANPAYERESPLYPYDPARARALLKESGYPKPTITLWSYPRGGVPEGPQLVEAIASYWGAVGMDVTIKPSDYTTWRGAWSGKTHLPGAVGWIASPGGTVLGSGVSKTDLLLSSNDEELFRLGAALNAAKDLESYKVAARAQAAYQRDTHRTGTMYTIGAVFVTGPKVKEWQFSTVPSSWDIENLAER